MFLFMYVCATFFLMRVCRHIPDLLNSLMLQTFDKSGVYCPRMQQLEQTLETVNRNLCWHDVFQPHNQLCNALNSVNEKESIVLCRMKITVLASRSWHKENNTASLRNPVVDRDKMSVIFLVCLFSALCFFQCFDAVVCMTGRAPSL